MSSSTVSVLLFVTAATVFLVTNGQDTVQLEDKSRQSWSKVTDLKAEEDDDLAVDEDKEDKRGAHIFRYGRAPVFRYGKRAPSVFRYGKKATVFRYGKRSDDLASSLTTSNDKVNAERLSAAEYGPDYFPVAEEQKRKIFRYGKRSA